MHNKRFNEIVGLLDEKIHALTPSKELSLFINGWCGDQLIHCDEETAFALKNVVLDEKLTTGEAALYLLRNRKLTCEQVVMVFDGYMDGLSPEDVHLYAKPGMDTERMFEIRQALMMSKINPHMTLDAIQKFATTDYTVDEMFYAYKELGRGASVDEIEQSLERHKEEFELVQRR